MKSRSWLREFGRACGIISLLAAGSVRQSAAADPAAKPAAFALLDASDSAQWESWAKEAGWKVIVPAPALPPEANVDTRLQALVSTVQQAIRDGGVDGARVYLAGRGVATAAVFYGVSRVPDMWAAAVAVGGSPQPAIDSSRIFTANYANTPILWAGSTAEDQALAEKLKAGGLNLEWRSATGLTVASVIQWLGRHEREEFPLSVDCEAVSTAFAHCYWTQMTNFDMAERNDVLPTTLVPPNSGASLDLGGFVYRADDPGPGVPVASLPEKYEGPLKIGDRIVALDGKPLENPKQYNEIMRAVTEEKPAVVMVERGKERRRIETRVVLPRRQPVVSARIQAKYIPAEKEIQLITRAVTGMRVTIPPHWVPATLYWNGLSMEDIQTPGCIALRIEKELLRAGKCQ